MLTISCLPLTRPTITDMKWFLSNNSIFAPKIEVLQSPLVFTPHSTSHPSAVSGLAVEKRVKVCSGRAEFKPTPSQTPEHQGGGGKP